MGSSASFFAASALLCLTVAPAAPAEALQLAPYKDDLFRYRPPIVSDLGGDHLTVPFDHQRDVVARDEIPDERTRPEYVSLDVRASEADLVLRRDGQVVRYVGVGRTDGDAKVVVIFLHGLGATRLDGANDWRSGGNLNRIKNLMVRNDGVYLSADYGSPRRKAKRQIAALIDAFAENSPGAPIFLICASIGARICWDLAEDPKTAARLDGLLMIAAVGRPDFADSALVRDRTQWVPIYMAHGNRDRNVGWRPQDRLFREIKSVAPDYPIKFVLFDTGTHRAPLRMTDWRLAINWMLEINAGRSP
jgi:pimeloyl-ACP methyl ester carboxylesterase